MQISTSDEPGSFFLAPPLIIEREDLLRIVEAVDAGLSVADEAVERSTDA